jgi:hypothetical protein
MSLSQPLRTLLLAGILITAAVAIRSHFDSDLPAPPAEEEPATPVVRVARDAQPTIVESNEDWMDASRNHDPIEHASPLAHPDLPTVLPEPAPVIR